MSELELYANFWPTTQNIQDCIGNEAETLDESVFLAVHQPTTLIKRNYSSGSDTFHSEEALLAAFLDENLPSGTLVMPITGASGAGKSHLIRWLAARIAHDHKSGKLHVIRLPKSAGLRTVVESILQELPGPGYDEVRRALDRLAGDMSPDDCARRLANELSISLSKGDSSPDPHARNLSILIMDPVVQPEFMPALRRIADRALGHRTGIGVAASSVSPESPQFDIKDFEALEDVEWLSASAPAQRYWHTLEQLRQHETAVKILNDAIDGAISAVFQLQSLHGVSISEIIQAIRRQLFHDGRELILLVEDFAALAGIQNDILMMCIQEAVRDGKQEICRMRTALAVTDGYLNKWDTIRTRAQHEWRVVSSAVAESDDERLNRMCTFVGAYLNAARYGVDGLKRLRDSGDWDGRPGCVPGWRDPKMEDDEYVIIRAFGETMGGVPLFPFNREAIEFLYRKELCVAGSSAYTPRDVINQIIRNLLLNRDAYIRGELLNCFAAMQPNMFVAGHVRDLSLTPKERAEVGAALMIWGGAPGAAEDLARFIPDVLRGLGFAGKYVSGTSSQGPSPVGPGRGKVAAPRPLPEPPKPAPLGVPVPPVAPKKLVQLSEALTAWANGEEMNQETSQTLRGVIVEGIANTVDWETMGAPRDTFKPNVPLLNVPNSRGGGSDPLGKIQVCGGSVDSIRSAVPGLVASYRLKHARSTERRQLFLDLVDAGTLVGRLTAEFETVLHAAISTVVSDLVRNLAACHVMSGSYPVGPVSAEQVRALLTPCSRDTTSAPDAWGASVRAAQKLATDLQKTLDQFVCCYQGTGTIAMAVMPWRLRCGLGLSTWPTEAGTVSKITTIALRNDAITQDVKRVLPLRSVAIAVKGVFGDLAERQALIEREFVEVERPVDLIQGVSELLRDLERDYIGCLEENKREVDALRNAIVAAAAVPAETITAILAASWKNCGKETLFEDITKLHAVDLSDVDALYDFAVAARRCVGKWQLTLENAITHQDDASIDEVRTDFCGQLGAIVALSHKLEEVVG